MDRRLLIWCCHGRCVRRSRTTLAAHVAVCLCVSIAVVRVLEYTSIGFREALVPPAVFNKT